MQIVFLVVVLIASVARADAGDVGARVYAERCSGCHGDDGRGDGPAAAALVPKPRNLRDASFWHDRSAASIATVVRKGKPGTMMAPFEGTLTDAEIDAVVEYLRRFDPSSSNGRATP